MKNKAYIAFEAEKAKNLMANAVLLPDGLAGGEIGESSWLIHKNECRTLYDGRYCAVSGFFFAIVNGKYSVLAEKRGEGTPDFQGYWCCPCGFLERDENSKEGIKRETREECGVEISYNKIKVIYVETEPGKCNNGNVTIRHTAFLGKQEQGKWLERYGGEVNEVSEIKWIPVDEIDDYKWAFGHQDTILDVAWPKWKRILTEIYYL